MKVCPGAMLGYTTTTTQTGTSTLSSSEAPACTVAPLSLDDDEGNNMPDRDWILSSMKFRSHTASAAGTSLVEVPSSSEAGSSSSSEATTSSSSEVAAPGSSEATASSSSEATTSSATEVAASSSSEAESSSALTTSTSTSDQPTPTPVALDRYGRWMAEVHLWIIDTASGLGWTLYDPNIAEAGFGIYGGETVNTITHYIESQGRAEGDSMPYRVRVTVTNARNPDKARVQFVMEKDVPNCPFVSCQPSMTTEDKTEDHMFEVDGCEDKCRDSSLQPWDFWCFDLNDSLWIPESNGWKRVFYCGWKGF